MNKLGVLVTRGQPLHSGHIKVINQALCENDKVLIVIGSADNGMLIETHLISIQGYNYTIKC